MTTDVFISSIVGIQTNLLPDVFVMTPLPGDRGGGEPPRFSS
jgi:hypothetical protein